MDCERDDGGMASTWIEKAALERGADETPKSPLINNTEEHGREASSTSQ